MKRIRLVGVTLALALVLCTSAWAGSQTYYAASSWAPGQGSSSSFSSGWMRNVIAKSSSFDSTITFIDNVSYGWHSTLRGPGTYLSTHWLSSQVKKGHCRSNVVATSNASCTVVS